MGVITDIENLFLGFINGITHNLLGLLILIAIGLFIFFKYNKPKERDMALELFNKQWDATTQKLGLLATKKLGLCSYPFTLDQLKSSPIHQIQYRLIGDVIGINVVGVRTSLKHLTELSKELGEDKFNEFVATNAEQIDADKFWVVFAVRRQIGGIFLFPKISKSLLYCKPNQIIDLNSKDNVIRVRGYGITPQGMYELINDENINVSAKQLLKDTSDLVFDEITISTLARMGTFVENATKLDSTFRKEAEIRSIEVQAPATGQEVKT